MSYLGRKRSRREFLESAVVWGSIFFTGGVGLNACGSAGGEGGSQVDKQQLAVENLIPSVEIERKIVNGLETIGSAEKPLSEGQFRSFVEECNRQLDKNEIEIRGDIGYATFVITQSEYASWSHIEAFNPNFRNETLQAFLKRHEAKMNQVLEFGAQELSEKINREVLVPGFNIRRLVVVQDDIGGLEHYRIGGVGGAIGEYFDGGVLRDSDGLWWWGKDSENFFGRDYARTTRELASKWGQEGIELTLLHELGHQVFGLPDLYFLAYTDDVRHPQPEHKTALEGMPYNWQRCYYYRDTEGRTDLLMNNNQPRLGGYSTLVLHEQTSRQQLHASQTRGLKQSEYCYPDAERPSNFLLKIPSGVAQIQVYRTKMIPVSEGVVERQLVQIINRTPGNSDTVADLGDPFFGYNQKLHNDSHIFQRKKAEKEELTILIKLTMQDGSYKWAWRNIVDIRTFNLIGERKPTIKVEFADAQSNSNDDRYWETVVV